MKETKRQEEHKREKRKEEKMKNRKRGRKWEKGDGGYFKSINYKQSWLWEKHPWNNHFEDSKGGHHFT